MIKTSVKIKQLRATKSSSKEHNRCKICGRLHAYLHKFGTCCICFHEFTHKGKISGVKKASW